jgi:colicin import membrane protein
LFDESGLLIGITVGGMKEGQNLNFALPVDWVDKTLQAEARRREQDLRRAEQQLHEKERQLQEEQQRLQSRAREAAASQARAAHDAANAAAGALKREEDARRALEAELKAQKEEIARLRQQLRSEHPETLTASPAKLEEPASPHSSAIDADVGAVLSPEEEQRLQEARQSNELRMEQEAEARRVAILDEQQKLAQDVKARADEDARKRALAEATAAKQKQLAQFMERIKQKVRGKVVLPQGINGNPEAVYSVTLLPGGEVLDVKLIKSSGVPAYDSAVERAIRAADPLPVPSDSDLFQKLREANYRFRPLE